MPSLFDIISQLQSQAQPRPDLTQSQSRPYTFAGRIGDANQPTSVTEMMMRQPTESPDAEGMGAIGAMAGTGIPLGRAMKIKPGTNLNQVLEDMYKRDADRAIRFEGNPLSRDQWMKSKINDLALSTYRDPQIDELATIGGKGGFGKTFLTRPSPSEAIGQYNVRYAQDTPRLHQLAAILNMADRSGLLNAQNLTKATAEQGRYFKAAPNQSILNQLSDYLEQIRPERK